MARGSSLSRLTTMLGIGIVLAGVAGFAIWAATLPPTQAPTLPPTQAPPAPVPLRPAESTPAATPPPTDVPASPPAVSAAAGVRDITPTGVTPSPVITGPLSRKPGREPPPPPPERVVERRLPLPVVEAAGRLRAGDLAIVIDGVDALAADASCEDAAGRHWPCGARAATALKALVRARAVTCVLGEKQASGAVSTSCRLGKTDLALWLVENGWADPPPGSPLAAAAERARAAGRGRFRANGGESLPAATPVEPLDPTPLPLAAPAAPEAAAR